MAEELDAALETPSESEARIKDLSGKTKKAYEDRDAEKAARDAAEARASEAERERDFYSGFSDVVSTNPAAKDHKDEILAKVKAGYTTQDATYAVLGAAGKLNQGIVERHNPAGGSASTQVRNEGEKTIAEMSQAERREALMSNEGALVDILSPRAINQ